MSLKMPKTSKFDVLGNTSSGKDKNNFAILISPINNLQIAIHTRINHIWFPISFLFSLGSFKWGLVFAIIQWHLLIYVVNPTWWEKVLVFVLVVGSFKFDTFEHRWGFPQLKWQLVVYFPRRIRIKYSLLWKHESYILSNLENWVTHKNL